MAESVDENAFLVITSHLTPPAAQGGRGRESITERPPLFRCVLSRPSDLYCSLWPGKWLPERESARIMISFQNRSETRRSSFFVHGKVGR